MREYAESSEVENPKPSRLNDLATLRMVRCLKVALWFVEVGALVTAVIGLAVLPNVERAILLYFLPPLLACLFLVADTGRFNRTVVRGCHLFLAIIAVFIVLGHLPFVLPQLKPQFPGMAPQADRLLVFYFFAYALFLWFICPAYVFGTSLATHVCGSSGGKSRPIFFVGLLCWVAAIVVLVVAVVSSGMLF